MVDLMDEPLLIVLIVLVAAAFLIAMGFGISGMYVKNEEDPFKDQADSQKIYMRDVRLRYIQMLQNEVGRGRGRRSQYS